MSVQNKVVYLHQSSKEKQQFKNWRANSKQAQHKMENNELSYAEQVLEAAILQVQDETGYTAEDVFEAVCNLLDIKVNSWQFGRE